MELTRQISNMSQRSGIFCIKYKTINHNWLHKLPVYFYSNTSKAGIRFQDNGIKLVQPHHTGNGIHTCVHKQGQKVLKSANSKGNFFVSLCQMKWSWLTKAKIWPLTEIWPQNEKGGLCVFVCMCVCICVWMCVHVFNFCKCNC